MVPHLGRSAVWALLESGGPPVLSLVVLFVIARLLGPTDLGLAALALGIIQTLAIIPETLLHDALIQRESADDLHFDTAFWTCLLTGILLAAGCFVLAPQLARVFGHEGLEPLLKVASIGLCFSGASTVAIASLRRKFMFKAVALRTLYGRLLGAIAAIVLAVSGFGVWSLIAQFLIQSATGVIVIWYMSPWRPRWRFDARCSQQLLSFGLLSVATRVSWLSSTKLFTVLVGYFLGVTAVGYLNVAQRVVDTMHDLLAGAVYNLALPTFARQKADPAVLARVYRDATELTTVVGAPIFGGIAVCATTIISVFAGEQWLSAAPLIQILALGALIELPFLLAEATITALGRPGYAFLVSVIALGFLISAFALFPPSTVFVAAALWSSKTLICAPVGAYLVSRVIRRDARDWLLDSWAPLVSAGVMALVVMISDAKYLGDLAPFFVLLVEIALGAIAYVGVLALLKRALFFQVINFLLNGMRTVAPSAEPS